MFVETPTFKEIFRDIFRNLKTIFSDLQNQQEGSSPQPPAPRPSLPPPESLSAPQPPPAPPESPNVPQAPPLEPPSAPQAPLTPPESPDTPQAPLTPPEPPDSPQAPLTPPESPDSPQAPLTSPESPDSPQPPSNFEGLEDIETQPVEGEKAPENLQNLESSPPPPADSSTQAPPSTQADSGDMSSELSIQIQSSMSSFIYDPVNKKDPFEDPTVPEEFLGDGENRKIPILSKTPPEEHDLKEISLKGIIWDTKNPKALFQLPGDDGYYTLIKGDKIGTENGVIFEIRESEVVIVELQVSGKGDDKQEKTIIKIKKIDRLGLFN